MDHFRKLTISGTAFKRGRMHGEMLADEIAQTVSFYRAIFKLPEDVILERAAYFRDVIADFSPDYAEEINGIAQGCGMDPLWITALNARTEILALSALNQANECTALSFPATSLLGQNWDWGKPLESLCVMLRIERADGHVITMMTEPGIIGKIGMNSTGLGVCLNILTLGRELGGVPIHVLLRGILDCTSIDQARALIERAGSGKSSNVLVGNASGDCFDSEFAGDEVFTHRAVDGTLIHTNHYLGKDINATDDPKFASSYARMHTATTMAANRNGDTIAAMRDILSDASNNELPILRPYIPDDSVQELGTVCSIIMDLSAREMHVRKGPDPARAFKVYAVS